MNSSRVICNRSATLMHCMVCMQAMNDEHGDRLGQMAMGGETAINIIRSVYNTRSDVNFFNATSRL